MVTTLVISRGEKGKKSKIVAIWLIVRIIIIVKNKYIHFIASNKSPSEWLKNSFTAIQTCSL